MGIINPSADVVRFAKIGDNIHIFDQREVDAIPVHVTSPDMFQFT